MRRDRLLGQPAGAGGGARDLLALVLTIEDLVQHTIPVGLGLRSLEGIGLLEITGVGFLPHELMHHRRTRPALGEPSQRVAKPRDERSDRLIDLAFAQAEMTAEASRCLTAMCGSDGLEQGHDVFPWLRVLARINAPERHSLHPGGTLLRAAMRAARSGGLSGCRLRSAG